MRVTAKLELEVDLRNLEHEDDRGREATVSLFEDDLKEGLERGRG